MFYHCSGTLKCQINGLAGWSVHWYGSDGTMTYIEIPATPRRVFIARSLGPTAAAAAAAAQLMAMAAPRTSDNQLSRAGQGRAGQRRALRSGS